MDLAYTTIGTRRDEEEQNIAELKQALSAVSIEQALLEFYKDKVTKAENAIKNQTDAAWAAYNGNANTARNRVYEYETGIPQP